MYIKKGKGRTHLKKKNVVSPPYTLVVIRNSKICSLSLFKYTEYQNSDDFTIKKKYGGRARLVLFYS